MDELLKEVVSTVTDEEIAQVESALETREMEGLKCHSPKNMFAFDETERE